MSKVSLDEVSNYLDDFLLASKQDESDNSANWHKLRQFFLDVINKRAVFEPDARSAKLLKKVKALKGYGTILTDSHINRVFPAMKYQFHINDFPGEKTSAIKIHAPTYSPPKSARPRSIDTPHLTMKQRIKAPKTARFPVKQPDPDNNDPIKPFPVSEPSEKPKINDLIPTLKIDPETHEVLTEINSAKPKWTDDFTLATEKDALMYAAAVDPEYDFLHFHFGKRTSENPYKFEIINRLKRETSFETVTRHGVIDANNQGQSEFTPLHQYVINKAQYEMLRPIKFFSQFKIYKSFNYWRLMTIKKLFMRRLDHFSVACWSSKPPYPPIIFAVRKSLLSLKQYKYFPVNIVSELNFETISKDFAESREEIYKQFAVVSGEIRVALTALSKQLNEYFAYITSPRVTDYLEMKKIPAELFYVSKVPFKKSQSIVEAKEMKKEHEKVVKNAEIELNALQQFLLMCDKMVIQFFLQVITTQFKDFVQIFLDPAHESRVKCVLKYESETLIYSPSYRELSMMFQEHFDTIFDFIRSFIRPSQIDPTGGQQLLDPSVIEITLDEIIKNDPKFVADMNSFKNIIDLSYKQAKETYKQIYPASIAVFKFNDQWEQMKASEKDPNIYINNLSELTKFQETINTFKGTYLHQILMVEIKDLNVKLKSILTVIIEENNSILFRNFESICKNISKEIGEILTTLTPPEENLEAQADFNLAINKAVAYQPSLEKNVQVVNSIFSRALDCANLLVPVLVTSLDEMRTAHTQFKSSLETAQRHMAMSRASTIATLVSKQRELEDQMNNLERRTKSEFSTVETNIFPETAIQDLNTAMEKVDKLASDVKEFENTATRLNYNDFDFSQLGKTKEELQNNLGNWTEYQKFMNELNSYLESNIMEVDIPSLINFLNTHNEREMRSANHPLFDKMAHAFAQVYQYLPFFQLLSKIDMNEEHWLGLFQILEVSMERMQSTKLKKFLSPKLLTSLDAIRSYILNLQQRADLSQSFDGMILNLKGLVLRITYSPIAKTDVIAFPSIHEAMNTCVHFILYLKTLQSSQFYNTIEQQVEFWYSKLKTSIEILNALLLFQTRYIYYCTATVATFGETQFPIEAHALAYINSFFSDFVKQIEIDPHVLSLLTKSEDQLQNEIDHNQALTSDQIDSHISNDLIKGKRSKISKVISVSSVTQEMIIVNKDLNKPIPLTESPPYLGDQLIQFLDEARSRCDILMENISHMIDIQRQTFPRFYFCTDEQVINIFLACSNLRLIMDDLIPIFPSLSRFHVSVVDTARVMGIINTNGETFQFSRDFDFEHISVVELLRRTEKEMQTAVRSSILDALSSREYTEPGKWMIRYPVQSLYFAESIFFSSNVSDIFHKNSVKPDYSAYHQEIEDFIASSTKYLIENPSKSASISSMIAMKLRHRDILEEIEKEETMTLESYAWKRHLHHSLRTERAQEEVFASIGGYNIQYGYELTSQIGIGFMTNDEEEAALALAGSFVQPELALCKIMNCNRDIIKSFSDMLGLPCFNIYSSNIRNIFAGASAMRAVVRMKEVKELPALFPNFFGLIEARSKILKCESHFNDLARSTWNCVIHVDETKVPSWLMQRLRPIYLNTSPPNELRDKILQVRSDFVPKKDLPLKYVCSAILQPNAFELITIKNDPSLKPVKGKFFYNVPEYLLTNQMLTIEDPSFIDIPEFVNEKMKDLAIIFEKYDCVSPHSQSQDFPIRPFPLHIPVYAQDILSAFFVIFGAFGEQIRFIRPSFYQITENVVQLEMIGYRPIIFDIYNYLDHTNSDAFIIPPISIKDYINMMQQQIDLLPFYNDIRRNVEKLVEKCDNTTLNTVITKLNITRFVYASNCSIPMPELCEKVFVDKYQEVAITKEDLMNIPFKAMMPIVITGPISSGKRSFAKKMVNKKCKAQDIIIYSSSHNDNLPNILYDKLKFISRGLYGPPDVKMIYLCIFDYQDADEIIKKFVYSLIVLGSFFAKQENEYIKVQRLQLVITTTDPNPFFDIHVPFYLYKDFEQNLIKFDNLEVEGVVSSEVAATIHTLVVRNNLFTLCQQFIPILHQNLNPDFFTETHQFLVMFSIFFGAELTQSLSSVVGVSYSQIKQMQNHNGSSSTIISETNYISRVQDVINFKQNAILIYENFEMFKDLKNTEFVVLNNRFRTQLFSAMVKVSQEKRRTTFVLNMEYINNSDIFNFLDFLLFNKLDLDYSTIFEIADLQIFKHYMDPHGEDQVVFGQLMDLINIFIVCKEEDYQKIPQCFRTKMITIRQQRCDDLEESIPEAAPYVGALQDYVKLVPRRFNEMVTSLAHEFREHFQEFIDEIQTIVQFFTTLTSMRNKVESAGNKQVVESDAELSHRMEQLELKIADAEKRSKTFNEEMREKANELSVIQAKLAVQAPNEVSSAIAALCTFSLDEQVEQINQWLATKDDFYIFVNIFKDLFHFITPANFTDTAANSTYCKLVTSIRQFSLSDSTTVVQQKLSKYGLSGDSPAANILNKISFDDKPDSRTIPSISPIPLVNAMLTWLSIVVKYSQWQEEVNTVTAALTQLKNRANSNDARLIDMKKEYDEASAISIAQNGGMECPQWLLNAWNKDEADCRRLFDLLDDGTKVLMSIVASSVEAERNINAYAAFSIAYQYGLGSLTPKERKEILDKLHLDFFLSPFNFVDRGIDIELFFPVLKFITLFTPAFNSKKHENDELTPKTAQIFNTTAIFDQILFHHILPQQSRFFQQKVDNTESLIRYPIEVFYDPDDACLQTLMSTFPFSKVTFTSGQAAQDLFDSITKGSILFVHIDSVESGLEFFRTVMQFVLHINATQRIQYDDANRPMSNRFKMFIMTKISPKEFPNLGNGVIFSDMSIGDKINSQWFEFSCVFAVNPQIEALCISLLGTISSKTSDLFVGLRRLSELAHDTWPQYFENPQKQVTLRSLVDSLTNNQGSLLSACGNLKQLIAQSNDHPQAIYRYQQFVTVCKSVIEQNEQPYSVFQLLTSIRHFSQLRDKAAMAPISALNSFQEIIFDYVQCLPCKDRMQFQALFEFEHLKPLIASQHLLYDASFPRLHEKPLGPLMPQLISHVSQKFPNMSRQYFTFESPEIIPFPGSRPVVIIIDPMIPTDFYGRALSQHLPQKNIMLLTIGSFSNAGLSTPDAFLSIMKGCLAKKALFLVTYDELMPKYTLPAINYYAHLTGFVNYYIVVSKELFPTMPLMPNALVVDVSKPYTMSGANRLLTLFPSFKAESLHFEIPLIYLELLLTHRDDFPMKYHQILPMAQVTRDLWSSNQFGNANSRKLWWNLLSSIWGTLTKDLLMQKSMRAILGWFFKDTVPSIPNMQRVDFENDSLFASEVPPVSQDVGMMVALNDPVDKVKYGWKETLGECLFELGEVSDAVKVIHNCRLVNARWNDEITIAGEYNITLSVVSTQTSSDTQSLIIPVIDGDDLIGSVAAKCPGTLDLWNMASVHVLLPPK